MINSFADKRTAALFQGIQGKGIPTDVAFRAKAKLNQIHAAVTLDELRAPPTGKRESK